jgi:hypothetical protein
MTEGERALHGRTTAWKTAAMIALALATLLAAAGPAGAASTPSIKASFPKQTQAGLNSGQAGVLLAVKGTRSGSTTRVKLVLSVKQPWSGWTPAGSKKASLKSGRPARRIGIRIGAAARKILTNCGSPELRVSASWRADGRKRSRTFRSGRLRQDRSRCAVPIDVDLSRAASCDFIASFGNPCIAPFPNDYYTRKDPSSETGLRVNFAADATPRNNASKNVAVDALNLADGFSPGPMISVLIPGMDNQVAFDRTGIVPITDMSRAYAPDQPALLIDAKTGERQLIWGELDSNATQDKWRNLILRPGRNLVNGRRYIVALRNMRDAEGETLAAPPGFRLYRDNDRTLNQAVESQRARYESIFKTLEKAGVKRSSLYLAWDFTVASTKNLTGRMLSIRDRAFAELGDNDLADGVVQGASPQFQINPNGTPNDGLPDGVIDYPTQTGDGVENIRTVNGTFTVPCFLSRNGCPSGSTFELDADQKPVRIPGNTMTARFTCNIPRSAVDGGGDVIDPVRPSLYGHGLFGQYTETNTRNVRQLGTENGVMVCGTDWSGMASEDVFFSAIPALQDLSSFSSIPDRLQQGFLNFMFLGRLMIHPNGFTTNPAFRFNGESVIDISSLSYYGNSQGGIAGGALTAVAPDFTRSVLYVPGMNYSTLLTRSIDFDTYALILYPSYRNEVERPLIFSLIQMLWDRGEPNGYANNMTSNPLPGTPAHKVMIQMAYGDHQVANVATEVQARTIGAPLRTPALDTNRYSDGMVSAFFGHDTLGDLSGPAADGNAFFVWDIGPKRGSEPNILGTDPPPNGNIPPPRSSGVDPHDTVINASPLIRKQIADFMKPGGTVTNPCGLNPCYAAGWNGFP